MKSKSTCNQTPISSGKCLQILVKGVTQILKGSRTKHDTLDILILSWIDVVPLSIVEAKVMSVMPVLDSGEADDKIIAVAAKDMSVNHINDISGLPPHFMAELKNFLKISKTGEQTGSSR